MGLHGKVLAVQAVLTWGVEVELLHAEGLAGILEGSVDDNLDIGSQVLELSSGRLVGNLENEP
jgi:hypothetical protein